MGTRYSYTKKFISNNILWLVYNRIDVNNKCSWYYTNSTLSIIKLKNIYYTNHNYPYHWKRKVGEFFFFFLYLRENYRTFQRHGKRKNRGWCQGCINSNSKVKERKGLKPKIAARCVKSPTFLPNTTQWKLWRYHF